MRRVVVGALGLVVTVGCGRIGFDGASADAGSDGLDRNSTCDTTTWGTPQAQPNLRSSVEDWEPTLSPDGLRIVFSSLRDGQYKLYYAERPDLASELGTAMLISDLITTTDMYYAPQWLDDGTAFGSLQYAHAPQNGDAIVERVDVTASTGLAFGEIQHLTFPREAFQFFLTNDGTEMFFNAFGDSTPMHPNIELSYARLESGTWVDHSDEVITPEMNRDMDDLSDGWAAYDEGRRELWWERVDGSAPTQVLSAKREPSGRFGAIANHTEIGEIGDPAFSANGLVMAYAAAHDTGGTALASGADIFITTRSCQ